MKNLLTTTAVIEGGSGLFLVTLPALASTILFGSPLDTPAGLTAGRGSGVALMAIGAISWLMRDEGQSRAARRLVGALALYNAAIVAIFAYAGIGLGVTSVGLWPGAVVHAVMAVWCVAGLLGRQPR
jgi:hypothetical protein